MGCPTYDEILSFLASETAVGNRSVARHLLECPGCRTTALRALDPAAVSTSTRGRLARVVAHPRAAARGGGPDGPAEPGALSAGLLARLAAAMREVAEARPRYADLLRQPRGRWRMLVRNRRRYRSLAFARVLVEEARLAFFDDPQRAVELAELALVALDRLEPGDYGERLLADARGAAWAALGTAHRFANDLLRADEALARAGALLDDSADPVERALYLQMLGGLRTHQRRFAEARELLRRAIALYEEAGEEPRVARALTTLGCSYADEGSPAEALPPLLEALARVDEEADPRTALYVRHNLAVCLADLGEAREARRLFEACRPLYESSTDNYLQIRGRWLEGLIAAGCGEPARGEALLREARARLEGLDHHYDAALVSLDLAMILAAEGRTEEVRELARQATPSFLALGVHREAEVAVAFLRRAVEQDRATAGLVAGVAQFLKRARFHPELRFRPEG
jgi:tetratricopeptide (TPR) repeat protein